VGYTQSEFFFRYGNVLRAGRAARIGRPLAGGPGEHRAVHSRIVVYRPANRPASRHVVVEWLNVQRGLDVGPTVVERTTN